MDYIELLKNIDYFSFVAAFAKWIFLFLLLSILTLIIATKLNLFKRRTKVAKILVLSYYFIIPVYFMVFAIKYAPIKNSQIEINNAIDQNKVIATEFVYDFLSSIIADSLLTQEISTKDIVNRYLNTIVYRTDSLTQTRNLNAANRYLYKFKRKVEFIFLVRIVESKIVKKASSWIGIDDKTGTALYRADFNNLFSEGEIVEILKIEVNGIYGEIYKSMFLLFAVGLLIPIIEFGIAKIAKY